MKSLKYYIVLITMFFCGANLVHANVIINEVQIAPTEERFIELYNSGSSSVDLTDWYIQRRTATGSTFGSLVTKTSFEGKTVSSHGYFLISKNSMDNADIILDNLTITESNIIQIKNGGGEIVDKIGWGDANDCDGLCAPNPISGKSIQNTTEDVWVVATPTPGSLNVESDEDTNDEEEYADDLEYSESSSSGYSREIPLILKVTTKIISPKVVLAGVPFSISSLTNTNRGEKYEVGNYIWNFGDGRVSKTRESGPFEYLYEYPGEYVINLFYFNSFLDEEATATNKFIIKVIPSEIYVSSVGSNLDPFIEIENKSNYEIILSDWIITAGNHYFTIPKETIILPGKKIKFSPKITGFVSEDLNSVNITNKNKEIIAIYPVVTKKVIKNSSSNLPYNNLNQSSDLQNNSLIKDSEIINLNDLSASADKTGFNIRNGTYPILGLSGIIGIGIISFLLIKRNKNDEDIDKGIKAKDMTIVE